MCSLGSTSLLEALLSTNQDSPTTGTPLPSMHSSLTVLFMESATSTVHFDNSSVRKPPRSFTRAESDSLMKPVNMTACMLKGAARRDGEAATSDLLLDDLPSDLLLMLPLETVEFWEKVEGRLFPLDDS